MADQKPVEEAEDTGLSKATQTSDDDDVSLEDMDVTFDDFDEPEEDEAATESDKGETSTESDESEEEADANAEAEDLDEKPAEVEDTDTEAERKRFNAEMAKQRIAEKQAREAAKQAQDALEAERLQNYLAEAEDDADEYARRERNIEAYQLQLQRADLNAEKLQVGIDKALANIDLFRTGTPAVKKRLLDALDKFEESSVTKDRQGRPLEVKGDVYQYLVKEAESIRELLQDGAVQEAKTKEQTKARTITPPSRAPKEPKVDKDLSDFDKAWE